MYRHALTGVLGSETHQVGAQFVDVRERIAPHTHDFVEIALVVSGSGRHHTRSGTDDAIPGSVFLIRPGSWHAFEPSPRLTVANVYFDEHVLFDDLPWLFAETSRARRLLSAGTSLWHAPNDSFLDAISWVTELEKRPTATHMIRVGLLTCIMSLVTDWGEPEASANTSRATNELIREVVARVSADPSRDWSVSALAASANLSTSHFSRLFREEIGTPPARFVTQVRLERAARLLVMTDLSVARIGSEVGIPDANYFSRNFRGAYGVSPIRYRSGFKRS